MKKFSCGKMVELFSAVEILLWGIWVLIPTWNTFSSSPVFVVLKTVAPEVVWGLIASVLGVIEVFFIHREYMVIRRGITVINIFFFSLLGVLYGMGNIQSTAVITYFIFAGMSLYSYTQLAISNLCTKGTKI